MANTKELRRRIKSIKNTSQITRAMQMVSATKMHKAQNQAMLARPYSTTILGVLSKLSGKVTPNLHPLLSNNGSNKVGVILTSSDKGLCGALNSNLFRFLQSHPALDAGSIDSRFSARGGPASGWRGNDTVFYTIGKKGRDFVVRVGKSLEADFENPEHIDFSQALKIRKFILSAFQNEEIGEVYLLYPEFISTLRQEPKLVKVLPISTDVIANEVKQSREGIAASPVAPRNDNYNNEFLFEPNTQDVLEYALIHFLDTQIYQVLLETKASEHSARMVAMKNATDNAKDLVEDLTLTYNQARQDGITRELLEIASAGAALEGA